MKVVVPTEEVTVGTWIRGTQTTTNNTATRHLNQRTLNSASWRYIMADNKKQEKDFTSEVDVLLPEAESVAQVRSS